MIPKSGKSPADSRKSVGIQEFAALARSSLNGSKPCVGLTGWKSHLHFPHVSLVLLCPSQVFLRQSGTT